MTQRIMAIVKMRQMEVYNTDKNTDIPLNYSSIQQVSWLAYSVTVSQAVLVSIGRANICYYYPIQTLDSCSST